MNSTMVSKDLYTMDSPNTNLSSQSLLSRPCSTLDSTDSNIITKSSTNDLCDDLQIETCDDSTLDSIVISSWDKETSIYKDQFLKLKLWINENKLSFKLRKDRLLNINELIEVILFKLQRRNIYPVSLHVFFKDKSLNSILLFKNGQLFDVELLFEYIQLKRNLYIRVGIE